MPKGELMSFGNYEPYLGENVRGIRNLSRYSQIPEGNLSPELNSSLFADAVLRMVYHQGRAGRERVNSVLTSFFENVHQGLVVLPGFKGAKKDTIRLKYQRRIRTGSRIRPVRTTKKNFQITLEDVQSMVRGEPLEEKVHYENIYASLLWYKPFREMYLKRVVGKPRN
jgi:hypothetical protein